MLPVETQEIVSSFGRSCYGGWAESAGDEYSILKSRREFPILAERSLSWAFSTDCISIVRQERYNEY